MKKTQTHNKKVSKSTNITDFRTDVSEVSNFRLTQLSDQLSHDTQMKNKNPRLLPTSQKNKTFDFCLTIVYTGKSCPLA